MNLTKTLMAITAGAALLPLAAQAETKPTIVVMHENIHNQKDEANWRDLASWISRDGYTVVSVALSPSESASASRDHVVKLLDQSPEYGKLVLVGTAAASDTLSLTAQSEAGRVQSLVYVSAEPAVPTLGPRTVSEPNELVGKIASFQIKITNGKKTSLNEKGANMLRVRENGSSTTARVEDLAQAIEIVAVGRLVPNQGGFDALHG
jgi:hypothetical protein